MLGVPIVRPLCCCVRIPRCGRTTVCLRTHPPKDVRAGGSLRCYNKVANYIGVQALKRPLTRGLYFPCSPPAIDVR